MEPSVRKEADFKFSCVHTSVTTFVICVVFYLYLQRLIAHLFPKRQKQPSDIAY